MCFLSSFRKWLERRRISFVIKCIAVLLFFGFIFLIVTIRLSLEVLKASEGRSDLSLHSKETVTAEVFLVILLLSSPNNVEQRDTVRTTWLNNHLANVKSFFVIGTKELGSEEVSKLNEENRLNQDLLLLSNIKDSYRGLTEKLVESLKWIDANVKFSFIFKGDDDTFVRIELLQQELQNRTPERTYYGFFDGRARVKKVWQWAEPNWILCDRYLPHARGGGYVLSTDLVHYIATNAALLQRFSSEDISVGAWLGPLEIQRIHDPRFDTEYVSRGCSNSYIVTHKQDVEMMRAKRRSLEVSRTLCEKEFQSRQSYIYNWKVLPSLCCVRNNSAIP